MPLYTHNKFPLSQLKKLSAAVALALALPMAAHAAGLGKLTVLSSLGQPLRAEIELTSVSKEEEGALVARLAPADAFRKANIDVNPVLSSLRFSVEQRQGKQFIRITSTQVINEPFVDLLLELSGGGARLVREYTFLLDPPDMRKPQTAQASPPPAAAPAAAKPAVSAPAVVAAPAAPAKAATPSPVAPPAAATAISNSDEEPVSRIVTKAAPSSLAEELIRNGASSEQSGLTNAPVPAVVAEKTVPGAAAKSDAKMDAPAAPPAMAGGKRGKAGNASVKSDAKTDGKSYRVKEGDTLAEIANRTKDNTVSLDQMLVALYRANPDAFIGDNINRLRAGRVLSVPDAATAAAVSKGEARSTVVAQAQDFNAYRNKLAGQVANGPSRRAGDSRQSSSGKVTARVEEKSSAGDARDKLQLSKAGASDRAAAEKAAAEDKIAADKAIAEANDRVKALEKNVSDLQKLLEIKNKTLAEMSEQQKAAAKAEASKPPAAPVAEAKPEEKPAEAKPADAAPAEAAKPETPVPAPAPATPAPVAVKPKVAMVAGPPAKASFFDNIQDNPFVLPGAGALVALLAGWGFVRVRNNRKKAATAVSADADKEDEPGKVAKPPEPTPEVAAVAAASVATAEEPVAAEPVLPPAAVAEADAVDPISEAEMYISYGRDEQAEDILRLALKSDPDRQAIRLKLLEIYAKRQDVDGFNDVAKELHEATSGMGADWGQAVAMGILLDPANPLYGGVQPAKASVSEVAAEVPETPPQPQPEPPAPEEQGLEFDLSDFKGAEIQPGATPVADIGSKIDFDLELDSGKTDGDESAATKAMLDDLPTPAPAPALNDIDLDLPEPPAPPPQDVLEDDESAFAAEMSTKLDLAAAYQEIGDKEGARELLDEVIRGGSDSQIERAKDMLSKLS